MFKLRDYQIDISEKAEKIINKYNIVLLNLEVRTGKTLIALNICKKINAKNVLFVTKKKAISSIENDFKLINADYNIKIINYESLHKILTLYDVVIADEYHCMGAFPKKSKRVKEMRKISYNSKVIFLSGTPTPESFSQIYHPLSISKYSPFQHTNFYKWATEFVKITQKTYGYGMVNDYSNADFDKINKYINHLFINYTQKEAGFITEVKENVLFCKMSEQTYNMAESLRKDKLIQGSKEVILADTGVKLMGKLHQIYSGTCKFESGNSMILDKSKALFIKERFKDIKIALFYKFKEEYNLLKEVYGENLTDNLEEFNSTSKNIALQIVSGREGISLAAAKYIVYYNIDFSATSYWQSRDRLTTMDRMSNEIFWIFAEKGIEEKVYKAVSKKKNYTLTHFKKDYK